MSKSFRRRLALAAVTVLALTTLTGCFKVAMNLDLKSDDTVDGSIIFAIDRQYAALAGDQALSEAGLNPSDLSSLGADVQTKPYDDGQFVGQEIVFTGAPLSQLSQSMGADGATSGDTFSLTHADGQFVLDATMDMSTSLGDVTGDSSTDPLVEGMFANASFTVSITFPGTVTDTNGTVDGNTVIWKLDLSGPNTLHAVAQDHPGSGMSIGIWIGLIVVLIFLAGLGFLAYRNRDGPAPAPTPAGPSDVVTSPEAASEEPTRALEPPEPSADTRE